MSASGAGSEDPIVVDVAGLHHLTPADLDALVRRRLSARRAGRSMRLLNVSPQLRALLVLIGLDEVLGCPGDGPPPGI